MKRMTALLLCIVLMLSLLPVYAAAEEITEIPAEEFKELIGEVAMLLLYETAARLSNKCDNLPLKRTKYYALFPIILLFSFYAVAFYEKKWYNKKVF